MSAGDPEEQPPEPVGPSPWSREYAEHGEPRFAGPEPAGSPHPYAPDPYQQGQFAGYGAPLPPGPPVSYGQPWTAPGGPPTPPPRRRTGTIVIAIILALALAGGITGALFASSDSSNSPSAGPQPAPTSAPGTGRGAPGLPTTPPSPSNPFPQPNRGLVTTPPGLLAIGYRAYSLRLLDPSLVAIDANEETQFRRYGLSRVIQLRSLTFGRSLDHTDDWDADINVLTFKDAASARAELAYSNAQNKKLTARDKSGRVITLPGLPQATAFLNTDDPANGLSVGAFATVGRYQVVVILGGLSPNKPTDPQAVAAEAARVMKAVLPNAPDIARSEIPGGGNGPGLPFPTPSPSGTRA